MNNDNVKQEIRKLIDEMDRMIINQEDKKKILSKKEKLDALLEKYLED